VQLMEATLLHAGGDLRPHSGKPLRLVDDDAAPGLAHGCGHGVVVEGHDRAEVDHLDTAALGRGGLGAVHRHRERGPVGHEGGVDTCPAHHRPSDRLTRSELDVGLGEVEPFGFQEHHGVRVVDGGPQQRVRIVHGSGGDHLEAGGVGVVTLTGVAMVLYPADATGEGDPDDDRTGQRALGAVADLRHVRDDLLEGGVGEGVELHLDDRFEAGHGHADGEADDARLGQGGVEAPGGAEVAGQPVGHSEDPAQGADVLAEHDDFLIRGERVA